MRGENLFLILYTEMLKAGGWGCLLFVLNINTRRCYFYKVRYAEMCCLFVIRKQFYAAQNNQKII